MKKLFMGVLIILDLLIMGATGYYLYLHVTHQSLPELSEGGGMKRAPVTASPMAGHSMASQSLIKASTSTASQMPVSSTSSLIVPMASGAGGASVHHIQFVYKNSKAHQVSIRADFTGWKADPMKKVDATGRWEYTASLTPGEYAYCFTVDDKTFRDPSNKRTKQIGRTFVSSIVVKAPSSKP